MSDLEATLAYFRFKLAEETEHTQECIRSAVRDGPFGMTGDEEDEIVRHMEASFDITQKRGSVVKADYRPWLGGRRDEIDFFYWDRLKKYFLGADALPPQVVSVLDAVTDEILDYTGNPADPNLWARRGMVIGHVQSGKTTNYASLICKAADAGYKIIILLAGITNSLRQQTQERLDDYFIGKKSVFQKLAQEQLSIVNYASERRFPAYGTSRDRDFSKVVAATWGVTLSALNEPIIFITKKNKSTLENLGDWLEQQQRGEQVREPLLLIDDEADNASVNTSAKPNQVTAINKAIRRILGQFERSTYIGYTATPFANIFIDPSSEHEMLEDDLFPKHFIKALDPPSNYVGASRMFTGNGDLRAFSVRVVKDYQDILPLKHKKDISLSVLPESLRRAVRVFVLARAVRVLRGQGKQHCSMMINVSRFNDVQDRVAGLVYEYLETLKNAIAVNGGVGRRALSDPEIALLAASFESEYSTLGIDFLTLLPKLNEGASRVKVTVVNMKGGILDYRRHEDDGLHVIAIGGLALSRGLTLEGLSVSYILRNAGASDTLMQMARWFGYRPDYEDICRLYLPGQSRDHYEDITEAIEELRSEVRRMEQLNLTPENFGLKVRQSPAAIRITAANKMRSASELMLAQDYSGRFIEGYALKHDAKTNDENVRRVGDFLASLGEPEDREEVRNGLGDDGLMWTAVPGSEVMLLLLDFVFSDQHPELGLIQGNRSLFADYVADRYKSELSIWDVAVPAYALKPGENSYEIASKKLRLVNRKAGEIVGNGTTYKLTKKNKAANPKDERIGLSQKEIEDALATREPGARKFCLARRSPLMLIHLVDVSEAEQAPDFTSPVVASLSFCMPDTNVRPVPRKYQVNAVYRQQMLDLTQEQEDDEQMLDEADND